MLVGLWLLHAHPLAFLIVLGLFALAIAWVLPKPSRGVRWVFRPVFTPPALACPRGPGPGRGARSAPGRKRAAGVDTTGRQSPFEPIYPLL